MEAFRYSIVFDEELDNKRKSFSDCDAYFLHFRRCLISKQSHHFLEFVQSLFFSGGQVAVSFSEGMDDSALPAYGLLSLFAEFQEVVLDHSDDVEPVVHYFGVGKVFSDDVSVAGA